MGVCVLGLAVKFNQNYAKIASFSYHYHLHRSTYRGIVSTSLSSSFPLDNGHASSSLMADSFHPSS